jgi:hypothetical protein
MKIKMYRNVILHFVLYGRETWFFILKEKQTEDFREYGAEEDIWTYEKTR